MDGFVPAWLSDSISLEGVNPPAATWNYVCGVIDCAAQLLYDSKLLISDVYSLHHTSIDTDETLS